MGRTRGPIFYLLQAPNRRVVVGNLPGMPPVEGVVDFVPQTDTPEPEAEPSKLTGFGLTLSDTVTARRAGREFLSHYDAELKANRIEYREHEPAIEDFKHQAESATP